MRLELLSFSLKGYSKMTQWIRIEDDLPDGPGDIVIAKRKNGQEVKCYYHRDSMLWLSFYYKGTLSKFQDYKTLKFLDDVTHWMPLPRCPEKQDSSNEK